MSATRTRKAVCLAGALRSQSQQQSIYIPFSAVGKTLWGVGGSLAPPRPGVSAGDWHPEPHSVNCSKHFPPFSTTIFVSRSCGPTLRAWRPSLFFFFLSSSGPPTRELPFVVYASGPRQGIAPTMPGRSSARKPSLARVGRETLAFFDYHHLWLASRQGDDQQ